MLNDVAHYDENSYAEDQWFVKTYFLRIWMVLYLMSLRMTLFQGCFSVAVCIVAMLCSVRLFVLQCYT